MRTDRRNNSVATERSGRVILGLTPNMGAVAVDGDQEMFTITSLAAIYPGHDPFASKLKRQASRRDGGIPISRLQHTPLIVRVINGPFSAFAADLLLTA